MSDRPGSTALPSTDRRMPPQESILSPVAVTMMSAGSSFPDSSRMPCFGEPGDLIRHDRDASRFDCLEQVGIGHQADPLVPRLIAGLEVRVDVEVGRQFLGDALPQQPFGKPRRTSTELIEVHAQEHIFPADQPVGRPLGQNAANRNSRCDPPAGIETMYDGDRCSIVTWAACSAIAGTNVTAVAPLPITTTRLSR